MKVKSDGEGENLKQDKRNDNKAKGGYLDDLDVPPCHPSTKLKWRRFSQKMDKISKPKFCLFFSEKYDSIMPQWMPEPVGSM